MIPRGRRVTAGPLRALRAPYALGVQPYIISSWGVGADTAPVGFTMNKVCQVLRRPTETHSSREAWASAFVAQETAAGQRTVQRPGLRN